MSSEESRRAEALNRVAIGELNLAEAARVMQLSYRQAKRLYQRYRERGAAGLTHGNAGRPSNRAKPREFRDRVLTLVREHCEGRAGRRFGPTLLAGLLERKYGVRVNVETLRRWMVAEGLWTQARSAPLCRSAGASAGFTDGAATQTFY